MDSLEEQALTENNSGKATARMFSPQAVKVYP